VLRCNILDYFNFKIFKIIYYIIKYYFMYKTSLLVIIFFFVQMITSIFISWLTKTMFRNTVAIVFFKNLIYFV
jgi:hypothetical protein